MSKSPTTIELNGKRYDARTGVVIGDDHPVHPPEISDTPAPEAPEHVTPAVNVSRGQNLDGFVKRNVKEKPQESKTQPHHQKREPQKSHTLMRPAVKKPDIPKPDISRTKTPKLNPVVNHGRITRAETTSQSPQVSRFGNTTPQIIKKEAHLPVIQPSIAAISKGVNNELHKLEDALIDANSHLHELEHDAVKKVPFLQRVGFKNRFANITAMSVAAFLLVGFFAYQNSAQVSVRLAAARSGVSASLPGYKPAGFGIDRNVEYQPGKVAINFNSRTDDRNFTLTQSASNWSSASLLANFVDSNDCGNCYQTWQNQGKTVYTYNDSNATWVDGGVWYVVEGDSKLTSDQLLRLASSL